MLIPYTDRGTNTLHWAILSGVLLAPSGTTLDTTVKLMPCQPCYYDAISHLLCAQLSVGLMECTLHAAHQSR